MQVPARGRSRSESVLANGLWFDENIRLREIHWARRKGDLPPTLFVDDSTALSEVHDLKILVAGDHCIVGLNILHNLLGWLDRRVFEVASWEALPVRFFHHFILLDSVAEVTDVGPVNAAGEPVRVAEYSDSFPGAWRRLCPGFEVPWGLWSTGLRRVMANAVDILTEPAKMHTPLLVNYLPHFWVGAAPCGLFVVRHDGRTTAERQCIRDRAVALVQNPEQPSYRILTSNCEHFALSAKEGRWVSPQVWFYSWSLFRFGLHVLSIYCLASISERSAVVGTCHVVTAAEMGYHVFATIPIGFQILAQLVRTCIALTFRKDKLGIFYHYLIIKEVLRYSVIGSLTLGILALTPRWVWETRRVKLATFLTFFLFGLTNTAFNLAHQIVVRVTIALGIGLPLPIFEDVRDAAALSKPPAVDIAEPSKQCDKKD